MSAIMFATRKRHRQCFVGEVRRVLVAQLHYTEPGAARAEVIDHDERHARHVGNREDAGIVEHGGTARRRYAQPVVRAGCDGCQIGCLVERDGCEFRRRCDVGHRIGEIDVERRLTRHRLHHLNFGVACRDRRYRVHDRLRVMVVQRTDDEHRGLFIDVDGDLFLVDQRHRRSGRIEILRVDGVLAGRELLQLRRLRKRHPRQRRTIEPRQQCRAVRQRVHEAQESDVIGLPTLPLPFPS
jgi:hypothetical protein